MNITKNQGIKSKTGERKEERTKRKANGVKRKCEEMKRRIKGENETKIVKNRKNTKKITQNERKRRGENE